MFKVVSVMSVLLIILLSSCTKRIYTEIPVETVRTEYINRKLIDTLIYKDSVDRFIKGDTVFIIEKHYTAKVRIEKDTVLKHDTVPKILKQKTIETVEVEHTPWYDRLLAGIGILSLIYLIIIFVKSWKQK